MIKVGFKEAIPNYILKRKDKMGFPIPLNQWIKENKNVKEFVLDIFRSKKAIQRSYLKKDLDIENMIKSEGKFSRGIWALLSLEIWQQKFID